MPKLLKYRVKPGRTFGDFFQHGPGSIVELTEDQAGGFLDKLTLVASETDVVDASASEAELNHMKSLTVKQLQGFPEWQYVPAPKPTAKLEIIDAILAVRVAQSGAPAAGDDKLNQSFNNKLVLESMTIAELQALPEWDLVPEPKPTKKADIIAAILAVREAG